MGKRGMSKAEQIREIAKAGEREAKKYKSLKAKAKAFTVGSNRKKKELLSKKRFC